MTIITLDVADDLAAALAQQSHVSQISVQALSEAVLEQWFLDQTTTPSETWLLEDIAAIEDGLKQAKDGQTIPQSEASARLLARVR